MIHVINLKRRTDRLTQLRLEFKRQNHANYRIWPGVLNLTNPAIGIAQAHKQIVEFAKQTNLEYVTICEDDIHFTSSNSLKYYFAQLPQQFDLYLGSIISGTIVNNRTTDFSGLTLYTIHSNFYDKFLHHRTNSNLDRSLQNIGEYIVCNPIVAIQSNGYSDNLKQHCDYSDCFKNYQLYNK